MGTIEVIQNADMAHLDPARNYVSTSMMVGNGLIYRSLNGYREDDTVGRKVVGDLATDPGTDVNGDCTVWEWTLKEGLKYEDGSEITADHIGYAVSRSMAQDEDGNLMYPEGAQFLRQWIDPAGDYVGPYDGDPLAPGIEVDGNKITFTFDQPRCEAPFAMAMPTTAPIPPGEGHEGQVRRPPFSSGPYKIEKRVVSEETILVRNEHWDPETDPIRLAYPDSWVMTYGTQPEDITTRLDGQRRRRREPDELRQHSRRPAQRDRRSQGGLRRSLPRRPPQVHPVPEHQHQPGDRVGGAPGTEPRVQP